MSKTLGRLNMETFSALIRTDGTYPPWTAHTPDSKAAWQAAAEAVVAQYMKELTGCDEFQMGTFQIDNSKERALTHYYTDDEGVDHPIRTGTGGTLRDDDRIMAVIEAAEAYYDHHELGDCNPTLLLTLDWDIKSAVEAMRALDSEKE